MNEEQINESTFVQQHLANERTYLSWIRTSITVMGIGFLSSGLVFRSSPYDRLAHFVAAAAGMGSVLLGIAMMVLAHIDYAKKRQGIHRGTFPSSHRFIYFMFICIIMVGVCLSVLIYIMLFM